jgi:cell division protein FtsW
MESQTYDTSPVEPTLEQSVLRRISNLFKGDKVIWVVFITLCAIALVEMFSASSALAANRYGGNHFAPLLRHATFLIFGVGVILFIHNVKYKYFSLLFILGLAVSFILLFLIATGFIGVTLNAGTRWVSFFGLFRFQPSEIAKVSLMGTIAFLLSRQNKDNEKELFWWMIGLTVAVCGSIFFDNLSTAVLLFGVCFLLMFIGNVKITRLLSVLGGLIVAGVLFFLVISALPSEMKAPGTTLGRFNTWVSRVSAFGEKRTATETVFVLTDENRQTNAARIAIANSRGTGVFPGNSTARNLLPHAYSDFIYAIIIEELGLFGGFIVLLLYVIILIRAGMIARKTEKLFPKYLVLGSALMLSMQAFLHMAVNVGLLPVTGQPLPLISWGGTSVVITCVYFGLILSVDRFGIGVKKEEKG